MLKGKKILTNFFVVKILIYALFYKIEEEEKNTEKKILNKLKNYLLIQEVFIVFYSLAV